MSDTLLGWSFGGWSFGRSSDESMAARNRTRGVDARDAGERVGERETEDTRLVARVRAGDVAAYTQLFDAYVPRLWRFAARQLGSVDAAQDVVQDVFLDLWRRRATLDPTVSVEAYLFGAVRRRGLHLLRHERAVADSAERGGAVPTAWRAVAPVSPEDAAQAAELEAALAAALAPLSELQRSALALRRAGLTHVAIGAALQITPDAARKHVTRGLVALQAVLARFAPNGE
jgi:RNA polymerase sigma-70 factor (ECF subfamily)